MNIIQKFVIVAKTLITPFRSIGAMMNIIQKFVIVAKTLITPYK
jgi:hypothetical protein